MATPFKDYYQILQVHHDASPDVIKAAYRKLCSLYHPDASHNEQQMSRIAEINEAYDVLIHADKRREYQLEWLERHGQRSFHVFPINQPPQGMAIDPGKNVLDQFFHALYTKNWSAAYACLTLEDQKRITKSSFQAWREAVNECFDMQDYRIRKYRSYKRCRIGEYIYDQVTEYSVVISDMDRQTSQVSQSTTHKYAAFDGTSWKVCLGMKSLKQATMKFKLLSQRRKNFDPVSLYQSAVSKIDPLTGLLSEQGFYEEAQKEVERFRRYKNPVSLVAFQIHCKDQSRELPCLCQCASVIKASCRINDIVGRLSNNQIICLLAETNEEQAMFATKKFLMNIKARQQEPYQINAGVIQYQGAVGISDAVFAACSDASKNGDSLWINQKES